MQGGGVGSKSKRVCGRLIGCQSFWVFPQSCPFASTEPQARQNMHPSVKHKDGMITNNIILSVLRCLHTHDPQTNQTNGQEKSTHRSLQVPQLDPQHLGMSLLGGVAGQELPGSRKQEDGDRRGCVGQWGGVWQAAAGMPSASQRIRIMSTQRAQPMCQRAHLSRPKPRRGVSRVVPAL